jgi:TPP-dependent pyruvate/acetoin dehydrogenase alpha subunit
MYHLGQPDVAKRADGFGLPGVVVDGHDFFAVYEAAGEAISRARAGGGPSLLECKVNRYYGHEEGDSQLYRPPGEVEEIRATRDCLDQMVARLTARDQVSGDELAEIDAEARALIDEAVEGARAGGQPEAAELLTDVYVSY